MSKHSVDSVLMSVAELHEDHKEYRYNNVDYPVVKEDNIRFAIVPTNTKIYKAMSRYVDIKEHLTTDANPYPSFYTSSNTAEKYAKFYYPNNRGGVHAFFTTRPVKLFILNDVNNLVLLAELFKETKGVKGFLKSSRHSAIKELLMVTGLGQHCIRNKETYSKIKERIGLVYDDYLLNRQIRYNIRDEKQKRLTLYGVDLQFTKNMCNVMEQFGGDGYIASKIATAFGETAPVVHDQLMMCLTSNVLRRDETDPMDCMNNLPKPDYSSSSVCY